MLRRVRHPFTLLLLSFVCTAHPQQTLTGPDSLSFVLVAFSDVKADSFYADSTWRPFDKRHTANDFERLLSSLHTFSTPRVDDPSSSPRAPNREPVFGSMLDYFAEMSGGTYQLFTRIENPVDAQGYPLWLQLNKPKREYAHKPFAYFIADAVKASQNAGLRLIPSSRRKICWIYAGNRWNSIPPQCDAIGGSMMRVHERWFYPYDREDCAAPMTHIGMYCHEYAHLLGAQHHRTGSVSLWDLMGNGQKNAFSGTFGNLPAALDPWRRHLWGWLEFKHVRGESLSLAIDALDANYPILWEVRPSLRFILDFRNFSSGFMRSAPGGVVCNQPGVLLWRVDGAGISETDVDLIEADSTEGEMNAVTDIFRPGAAYSRRLREANGTFYQLEFLFQASPHDPQRIRLRFHR